MRWWRIYRAVNEISSLSMRWWRIYRAINENATRWLANTELRPFVSRGVITSLDLVADDITNEILKKTKCHNWVRMIWIYWNNRQSPPPLSMPRSGVYINSQPGWRREIWHVIGQVFGTLIIIVIMWFYGALVDFWWPSVEWLLAFHCH